MTRLLVAKRKKRRHSFTSSKLRVVTCIVDGRKVRITGEWKLAKTEGFIRLEADTLGKNKAMGKLAEKFGFKLEGTSNMKFNMNGRFEDETLLALLLK